VDAEAGGRIEALLADRPMAVERPGPALCSLTSRMVGYLDGSGDA
jgi:hypothetical protein